MRTIQPLLHDPEAFSDLYLRTHQIVYRFIFGMLGGPVEAVEDLTCESYMRAWRGRDHFHGDAQAALHWLFTIARHLVIDAHRKRIRRSGMLEATLDDDFLDSTLLSRDASPEEQIANREQYSKLWIAMQRLPDEKREVLLLRYMLDWRVKEIAEYVHKEENTVSVYIRRCLEEIQQLWLELEVKDESTTH